MTTSERTSPDDPDEQDDRDRIAHLHEGTAELVRAKNREELFDRVVDIAERILAFDQSTVLERDGDRFVDRAASPPLPPELIDRLPAEESLTARVHDAGEPLLVVDADDHPEAFTEAHDLRSAVMVPVGDGAIFQALSTRRGAYDETDLELAELLCSHATETLARIEAEAEAERRRERVTRLHRAATDMVGVTDPGELFQQVVEVGAEMLGFEHAVVFRPDGELFVRQAVAPGYHEKYPDEYPVDYGLMAHVRETGESTLIGDARNHPQASPVGVDFRSGVVVPVGDDAVFEGLSTVPHAYDETDLELAELLCSYATETLARIEAEAERRAQHDRFEALFQNVSGAAGFYELVDGSPHVRRVNRAFEETFGYDAEELVGENLDEYIVAPADREQAADFNERLERGEPVRTEVERQTADGPRHFLLQVIPLTLGERNAGGFAIYTDVSEQREREQELRAQNERLDEFASVVSHDLRNPLNVAQGYLELARETGDEEHLDRVATAHDRMDELVSELLTLAREGRDVGDLERVDLAAVAQQAWTNVDTEGLTLGVTEGIEVEVEADPDRLAELLENLFRNAVEHAGAGTTVAVGPLETRRSASDCTAGFYVADDGPGFDDIDVFEMGVTTSPDGTGFGLSIVQQIAEAHGWRVEAVRDGEGARFEFVF